MDAKKEKPSRPASLAVSVTQEHITAGRRSEVKDCPITRALTDAGFTDVRVDRRAAYVEYKGVGYIAPLPSQVRRFITDYDRGQKCDPFKFSFDYELET